MVAAEIWTQTLPEAESEAWVGSEAGLVFTDGLQITGSTFAL